MKSIYSTILILGAAFLLNGISAQTDSDIPAILISVPEMVVPTEAIEAGIDGIMFVDVRVDRQGNVSKVESVQGPGVICLNYRNKGLDALRKSAGDIAKQAKFTPAQKKGKPVNTTVRLRFDLVGNTAESGSESKQVSMGLLNHLARYFAPPEYPMEAKARRASGQVKLNVAVDKEGRVMSAVAESGHELLQPAGVTAACRSRFDKMIVQGESVSFSGQLIYNFIF